MPTRSASPADPIFFFHSGPTDLSDAIDSARTSGHVGIVLTGGEAQQLRKLVEEETAPPIIVDNGGWQKALATTDGRFAAVDGGGLVPMTLQDYVGPLLEAGARRVLTPTLTIAARGWQPVLELVLGDVDRARLDDRALTLLPLQSMVFDEESFESLDARLRSFGRPVAVIIVGQKHSMAVGNRLAVLRSLVGDGLVAAVFAAEPLIASDAAAQGAEIVSIGVGSGLRIPAMPGGSRPGSRNFLPGLFMRDILELRSPSVFADWYAGQPAPRCEPCGRALTVFSPYDRADKRAIAGHNLHEFPRFHQEMLEVDAAERRPWLSQERFKALSRHPQAVRPKGDVDQVLKRLIELDGLQPEAAVVQ